MDWFSHYIYAFVFGKKIGFDKLEMRALLVASLLPDIDFLVGIFCISYFRQYHRVFTHSLFVAPLMGLLLVLILYLIYKRRFVTPIMLGTFIHLLLDTLNLPKSSLEYLFPGASFNQGDYQMGIGMFWPFDDARLSLYKTFGYPDIVAVVIFFLVMLGAVAIFLYYIKIGKRPWAPFYPWESKNGKE